MLGAADVKVFCASERELRAQFCARCSEHTHYGENCEKMNCLKVPHWDQIEKKRTLFTRIHLRCLGLVYTGSLPH